MISDPVVPTRRLLRGLDQCRPNGQQSQVAAMALAHCVAGSRLELLSNPCTRCDNHCQKRQHSVQLRRCTVQLHVSRKQQDLTQLSTVAVEGSPGWNTKLEFQTSVSLNQRTGHDSSAQSEMPHLEILLSSHPTSLDSTYSKKCMLSRSAKHRGIRCERLSGMETYKFL